MMNDVIDNFTANEADNKKVIIRILGFMAISVVVLLSLFSFESYFSVFEININGEEYKLRYLGVAAFAVYIIISRFLARLLVEIRKPLKKYQIILCGGFSFFLIQLIFLLLFNILVLNYGFDLEYTAIFRNAIMVGMIGMVFVNVSFSRAMKASVYNAIGIACLCMIVMGYFYKKMYH